MQNKTSNDPNYNLPESVNKDNKNITCKDGYCFIPNSEENQTISNENINIFDPLQINLYNQSFIYQIRLIILIIIKYLIFLRINQTNIKPMHASDYMQKF